MTKASPWHRFIKLNRLRRERQHILISESRELNKNNINNVCNKFNYLDKPNGFKSPKFLKFIQEEIIT